MVSTRSLGDSAMPRATRTAKPIVAAINAAGSALPQTSYAAVVQWMSSHSKTVLAIELLVDNALLLTLYATVSLAFGPVVTFILTLLSAAIYLYERIFGRLRTPTVVEAACTAYDAGLSRWEARKARAAATAY